MKLLISLFLIAAFCRNANAQDYTRYEQKMISSGPGKNFPDFNIQKDSLGKLLVTLHNNMLAKEFLQRFKWTAEDYYNSLSFLETKNFVKKLPSGKYVPTCMVINNKDGETLLRYGTPIAKQIAKLIASKKADIMMQYATLEMSAKVPLDSGAFFILSNVILDNWQIGNVEDSFLNKPRPLRHGVHYYLALIENTRQSGEAFGIYGNQYYNDFVIYGNNRNSIDQDAIKQKLSSLPFVSSKDYSALSELSSLVTNDIVTILKNNRKYIQKIYTKTNYAKEVTFEEFFIWWYHLIYTKATDILAQQHELVIPKDGNFFYRIE